MEHQKTSCHGHSNHSGMIQDFKKRFWISTIATIPVVLLSPMIQEFLGLREILKFPGEQYFLFGLSSFIYFYGGWPFIKGFFSEISKFKPGMMTLIAVAITTAYIYSSFVVFGLAGNTFFWELATLIDIMLLGHWIEMRAVLGAGKALEELVQLMPAVAHQITSNEQIKDVPIHELKISDRVLVKPGEKIPVDGEVIKGETTVNEAMLTGESNPVIKTPGTTVVGGAINGEGSIVVKVMKTGKDTFLSQVIELVKKAQESKSKTQDLANRAAMWLTLIALGGGAITFIIWLGWMGETLAFALERTVTVMVITCPHALGLAVPLVVAVSTAIAAQNGLLIRNRVAFETARKINAVVFDKTGTLTEGKFGITDVIIFNTATLQKKEILQYAASLETQSEHPLAKTIAASDSNHLPIEKFKSLAGKGAEGIINGHEIKIVSPGYLKENNFSYDPSNLNSIIAKGKTIVFVIIDHQLQSAIALADKVRSESKEAIAELKKMNIRCMMLTGDNQQVAKNVADDLGLDEYFAEVLPQDKAAKIQEIQRRGFIVAMTGDGVNDAPALAQADVGIAIGAGTDVAIETADIILVKNNPLDVVKVISLARITTWKMIQNLLWATGYNIFAIPLAAGVLFKYGILLSPALGAVLMSLSTIIVAINAKLLRIK